MKRAFILSINSGIGLELAYHLHDSGYQVSGTYRNGSKELLQSPFTLYPCDLSSEQETDACVRELKKGGKTWDLLIFASGTLKPVGCFHEIDFSEWERSFQINCLRPLKVVHALLPFCRDECGILFFSGAGTNGVAPSYSCYSAAKMTLIKMTELLADEYPRLKFSILGPGWVKTKIHQETIEAGKKAGLNYERTLEKLQTDDCTEMSDIKQWLDWFIQSPLKAVSGKNFSVVHDPWKDPLFLNQLTTDYESYKLRRYVNDINECLHP